MCGGACRSSSWSYGGKASYVSPASLKKIDLGWAPFWRKVKNLDTRYNRGIFVELVRGCNNASCVFQCKARGMPLSVMPGECATSIGCFLENSVPDIDVLLYGMGDSLLFPFQQSNFKPAIIPRASINVDATVSDDVLAILQGVMVNVNVRSREDAYRVNSIRQHIKRAIVPVTKVAPWDDLFLSLKTPVLFTSLTPSWSGDYVSAEKFNTRMKQLGFESRVKEQTIVPGFKPVIESWNEGDDSLYAVLGVPRNALMDAIKAAYRRQVKMVHPDLHPGKIDEFKTLQHAYEVLGDVSMRSKYDAGLALQATVSSNGSAELVMRRCFQPESEKFVVKVPLSRDARREWIEHDKEAGDILDAMLRSVPDCKKCTETRWRYYFAG